MDIASLYELYKQSTGVTTDTRKVKKGNIYFALKGENFNGNTFASKALEQGASYAVIDEEAYHIDQRTILVKDVLSAMQQLAHYHLKQVNPKHIIAITGSNGKTTTKELAHAVLSMTFKTHYTKGNLNNHIGIPLTLLEMKKDTEIAVVEMGANHQKEIESYCLYTEPTHGIITNAGKAHLEGFGGIAGIRKGKGELYDYLKKHDGHVFVNGDDEVLMEMVKERNIAHITTYGLQKNNMYSSEIASDHPLIKLFFEGIYIQTNLYGSYNFTNVMCAIAVGKYFGVSEEKIKEAIENYFPSNARSQMVERDGYKIIMDSYNANPTSMEHALESFAKSDVKKKVAILGDMFELGEDSTKEHQFIADLCTQLNIHVIVLVGKDFAATQTPSNVLKFPDAISAQAWFKQQDFTNAEILLKGSRSMAMEKVVS